MSEFHFDEIIEVVDIDDKRYDKVSRIIAQTEDEDVFLELDVHSELYPVRRNEKYRMLITNSLSFDGSAAVPTQAKQISLADKFEYVMHGLLYKMAEDKEKKPSGSTIKVTSTDAERRSSEDAQVQGGSEVVSSLEEDLKPKFV